jgi:SAM-dependent methyltransferase
MRRVDKRFYKKILQLWKMMGIKNFWGDALDVRFYLAGLIRDESFDNILDISSNYGIILNQSNSCLRIGLDYSLEYLEKSKDYFSDLKLVQASSESLPFKDKSISAIILAHSLPGWDYPINSFLNKNSENARRKLFKDMHRILKAEGKLYLTAVNGEHIYYREKEKPRLDKIIDYAEGLFCIEEVVGWNPLPVLAGVVPYRLFRKFPNFLKKTLFFPTAMIYSFFPGIWNILLFLSKIKSLNKASRHLFFCLRKIDPK